MKNNEDQRGNPVPPVLDPMVDPAQGNEAPMIYTVRDALRECGVNDYDNFDGRTPSQRLAEDIFSDDFATCMDKTHKELDSDFKTYSDLPRTRGRSGSHQESRKTLKHLSNGHAMSTG